MATELQTILSKEKEMMDEIKDITNELQDSVIKGFDVEDFFMSDRQCVKKLLSIRNPELSDDDLNLVVFGRNIAEELGSSYKAFVSEKQFLRKKTDEEEEKESGGKKKKEPKSPQEKKKREKRKKEVVVEKDPDSPFKPIKDNDRHFEEIDELKSLLRKNVFLMQEKMKDLTFEVGTVTTLVVNSIPGMIAMIAPTSFNVPGAISLLMLALNNLRGIQVKVKEIIPLIGVLNKASVVVGPDKVEPVTSFVQSTTKTLLGLSTSIDKLQIISQAKITQLDQAQNLMEDAKNQLKNLRVEQFSSVADFEAKKKELEAKKEKIAADAEAALKG
jgi:hypothetical protein